MRQNVIADDCRLMNTGRHYLALQHQTPTCAHEMLNNLLFAHEYNLNCVHIIIL